MTMDNKILVYTVLAISLGYLLVSTIPSQIAPPMFGESVEDSELLKAPGPEQADAPTEDASAPVTELDENLSGGVEEPKGEILASEDSASTAYGPDGTFARDTASAQGDASAVESSSSNLVISVFGTWSVNLVIALGVYFIARRRLS
jgi:hypothetical protein